MAVELATAYVSVVASTGDLKESVREAFDASSSVADKGGRGLGDRLLGGVGSVLKGGALAIGATVAAGVGTALVKGFGRLTALDQANATLTGLGHTAESVDQIMANALASVKGTAFGLGDAGQLAATAVAAGIKPGQELERYLKLTADTAAIAGVELSDIGSVMNNVTTLGAAYNDSLQILAQKGLPIYTFLAEEMGVSEAAVKELASQGQISSEQFRAAIEKNVTGAALSMGDTFAGSFANVGAALGRVGANFLGPVFLALPPLFQAVAGALGPIESAAGGLGEKLASFLVPAIQSLTVFLSTVDVGAIFEMVTSFSPLSLIFQTLGPLLPTIANLFGMIAQAVVPLAVAVGAALLPVLQAVIPVFAGILAAILPVIGTVIGALTPVIAQLAPIFLNVINAILPLVAMILPLLTALLAAVVPVFMELLNAVLPIIAPILALVAPLLQMVGAILKPLISLIVMLVGVALKPMMMAVRALIGPILSVVGVIASSLVPIINAITTVLKGVVAFITGVFTGNWRQAWNGIVQIFSGIFNGIKGVVRGVMNVVIDLINGAIGGINDIAGAVSDATGGAINLKIGKIPRLAQGGVINRSAGGSIVNVGEGRYDEAVIPLSPNVLSQIGEAMGGSSSLPESLMLVVDGRPMRAYIAEGVAANDRLQGQRLSMGWAN